MKLQSPSELGRALGQSAIATALALASLLGSPVSAQGPAGTGSATPELAASLTEWRAKHGQDWQAVLDPETGRARFLHGGNVAAPFVPTRDSDFFVLARQALDASYPLHGVDAATLVEDAVTFLPLGLAGTTDKMTAQFLQSVNGVPVDQGTVNVLFDMHGRLLSIDVTGLPGLAGLPTVPAIGAVSARALAGKQFELDTRLPITREVAPELAIAQIRSADARVPRLAWRVEVFSNGVRGVAGFSYFVDAQTGTILRRDQRVHQCDVSGNVFSMATPGTSPDSAGNPETNQTMPHLKVDAGPFQVNTDQNGNFTFPGLFAPLIVWVRYEGPYCNTVNLETFPFDYSLQRTLTSSSGNTINMNPGSNWEYTAEANTFKWVNALHDWIEAVNPSNPVFNFQAQANVNLPPTDIDLDGDLDTCNAFYDGISVNFLEAGPGCENAAYSSVVIHEMGHWLNVLYLSFNGPDGFGEGAADVYAMYLLDNQLVGENFRGPGTRIRDGENLRQFCEDGNGGCYGEVHDDGEVLMGALWKVRRLLKMSLGSAAGGAVANTLFDSWMLGYNDSSITTLIETHWLTLDDNDGNLSNGTPHMLQIDGAFREQGFPGHLVYVDVAHTLPPWTGSMTNPFQHVYDALPNVIPGGTILIQAGTYTESSLTIDQAVELRATGGTAIVR